MTYVEKDPTIRVAQVACQALRARQVIVLYFHANGRFGFCSYGETRPECAAVAKLGDALFDKLPQAIALGRLPNPRAIAPPRKDRT